MACYDLALALDPESVTTHWNRSLALLQMGNYEQGWPAYEWRWQRKTMVPKTFPQLHGMDRLWAGRPSCCTSSRGLAT